MSVQYYCAASLDGYIAEVDDTIDAWVTFLVKQDEEWVQDRVPVLFQDDFANAGHEKAHRPGEQWKARDPSRHNYEVQRA